MEQVTILYICLENNETIVRNNIVKTIASRHQHFVVDGVIDGYWRGFAEDTLIVKIFGDSGAVEDTANVLAEVFTYVYMEPIS